MNYKIWLLATLAFTAASCGGSGDGSQQLMDDAPVAGCPGLENPDPTNTDGDLLFDVCDPDDDEDGFLDADDPAPLDASIPGDFSTPEAILANDKVKAALDAAAAAGFPVATEVGLTPPDISGYYIRDLNTGTFPATASGIDVGRSWAGGERRLEQANNFLKSAAVSYGNVGPTSFGFSEGTIIRGEGNRYTTYSRSRGTCTEQNSDYDTFSVSVASGTLNASTGNIENYRVIGTTIAVEGELTAACANRYVGEAELVGRWYLGEIPVIRNVAPSELSFMCVSGDAAYAPTETWTDSVGLSCSCTLDYEVACE